MCFEFWRARPGASGLSMFRLRGARTVDVALACRWSRWSTPEHSDLLSMIAITKDPPTEVAAVGHDRCVATKWSIREQQRAVNLP